MSLRPAIMWPGAALAGAGADYTAEALAYFSEVGSLSGGQMQRIDDLIRGLIDDGDWPRLSRLWLPANETETAALCCLVTQELMAKHEAPSDPLDFTIEGVAGHFGGDEASSSYLLSNFHPADDDKLLDDSAHAGVYLTTTRTDASDVTALQGWQAAGPEIGVFCGRAGSPLALHFRFNGNTLYSGPNVIDAGGHSIVGIRETGPTWYASKNGGAPTTGSATVVGRPVLPAGGIGLPGSNPFGVMEPARIGAVHFGEELNDAAIGRVAARINAYMTAIGANAY